ncbi:thioesterase family protein (plasmid) [Mesorhizobium sp. ORM8.1]
MLPLQNILTTVVKHEWVDYNGHMGDFAYPIAFNVALEIFLDKIGLGSAYREENNCTVYTLESHTSFLRELHMRDEITISGNVIDYDSRRIHAIFSMHNKDSEICAYYELMLMHMKRLEGQKPSGEPIPTNALLELQNISAMYHDTPRPERANASISIRRS